jgi:rubrerythrin
MEGVFNPAELVEIGIEKEKKRRDFYAAVAGVAKKEEIKELFLKLSAWEEEHVRRFSEIRLLVDEQPAVGSYPGELEDYMQALVADRLYSGLDPSRWSLELKKPLEAIRRGMEFEKDAILFFQELGRFLSSPGREIVDRLIREEKDHLVYLARLGERLKMEGKTGRKDGNR